MGGMYELYEQVDLELLIVVCLGDRRCWRSFVWWRFRSRFCWVGMDLDCVEWGLKWFD